MNSQSLRAQLGRMTLVLTITLFFVHSTPGLIDLLAGQAVDAGCHQSARHQSTDMSASPQSHLHHGH
ncbi:hypothetical protein [Endozoicomonas ascidiicola]|uniref:hypothetical protein n=1 Tax=Endozoicomonas ascidiicola TaxID=1698521 RepID=UPI00082B556F|nr:hypothetical protein [Endozoicomonas ascidiicola]